MITCVHVCTYVAAALIMLLPQVIQEMHEDIQKKKSGVTGRAKKAQRKRGAHLERMRVGWAEDVSTKASG